MSKPSAPRYFKVAGWITAIALIAVAIIALAGTASRQHRSASNKAGVPVSPALTAQQRTRIGAGFDALPVAFEANHGQIDPQVKYMARGNGYTLFLTGNEAVLAVRSSSGKPASPIAGRFGLRTRAASASGPEKTAAIRLQTVGGNSHPLISAGNQVPGTINYYRGNDRSKWVEGVKQYSAVTYHEVYPGVNLAFHGEQRQLEFDFIVSPGASTAPIELGFQGAKKITTDAAGNLVLSSTAGDVVLHKPVAYQEKDGKRELIDATFKTTSRKEVAFAVGPYDHTRELVIDPSVSYASYLGGSAEDDAFAIAVDGAGNAYVTGQTISPTFGGKPAGGNFDVFVTEFNATGSSLVYTDIFSGSGDCSGNAIVVDGSGNAYVGGSATAGFPVTIGQTTFAGGVLDGFALKLTATSGALSFGTYLGGSGRDIVNGIAVDGSGNIYAAGDTFSTNFPLKNAIQSTNNGGTTDLAFVTEIAAGGATLTYSTYLGGSSANLATAIALDTSNNAYVAGLTESTDFPVTSGVVQSAAGGDQDGFVTEVKSDGSAWVYSTYLGGSGTETPLGIAVDAAGEAYVTGSTTSPNFPTVNAVQTSLGGSSATNIFVSKLNAGATALLFSTYYGGNLDDVGTAISLDAFADAYVTGRTLSSNYPVSNSFQSSLSGTSDAVVTEFSNTGFVVYSSFLGGTGTENGLAGQDGQSAVGGIAVDSTSNTYLAGVTASTDFPVTTNAYQTTYGMAVDAFVAKITAAPADFSVAVAPTTASTASGQSTSAITVTVSSVNSSFGQQVNLTCGSLPAKATCNFSNASVTPGSAAVTSSLTISTNGSTAQLLPVNRRSGIFTAIFVPLVGIAILAAGVTPRKRRLFGILLGIALLSLLVLPACGGSGSGGGGGGGGGTTTPAGTYNITVVGSAGNTNHSAPLVFTVN